MKIRVLTFGIARDIAGKNLVELELPEGATAELALLELCRHYPTLSQLASIFLAVNSEYADPSTRLSENDEIALVPPVSGG